MHQKLTIDSTILVERCLHLSALTVSLWEAIRRASSSSVYQQMQPHEASYWELGNKHASWSGAPTEERYGIKPGKVHVERAGLAMM